MTSIRLSLLTIALAACATCSAQTAQSPAETPIGNLYMAGASYSVGASPAVAATLFYATKLNASGTYMFNVLDILPSTVRPYTVTSNVAWGISQRLFTIDKIPVFTPTAAGISYTGTNTGWSWSTGVGAPFPVKNHPGWYIMPTVRVLKSSVSNGTGYQPIFGILGGWGK